MAPDEPGGDPPDVPDHDDSGPPADHVDTDSDPPEDPNHDDGDHPGGRDRADDPNRNVLWGRAVVEELAAAGVDVAFAPGSRSTPLVVAATRHPGVETFSHLDERSAAFFALGRGRRTGRPTALFCTSGTAAANFHPAVIEADRGRVPLVVVTADRPPELGDSGANQTIDQEKLYGDAVRWYRDLPEPRAEPRTVRSLRTTVARAVATAAGTPPGPVHLNARFEKPLEPTPVPGDVDDFNDRAPLASNGREGGFVATTSGSPVPDAGDVDSLAAALNGADRALVVAGPADPPGGDPRRRTAISELAGALGAPLLADPLSGLRFGRAVAAAPVCGGYDGYLGGVEWPDPEVVLRVGASPTSKVLRTYLRESSARQFVVDPAGGWREATFTATDLVVADPDRLAESLAERVTDSVSDSYRERFLGAEREYWALVESAREAERFEGEVLASAVAAAPDPSTLFVSNSMPVRDLDRFGRPREARVTALGNRGASGIDGVASTAIGAASATDDPAVLVTGDLAYYHDTNGLLALRRLGVDATIVLVNNDGGGIFHMLPIEDHDPPFTGAFRTPHGLDFEPTGELYDLDFRRVDPVGFEDAYRSVVGNGEPTVLSVGFDAEDSHRTRERITERAHERIDG